MMARGAPACRRKAAAGFSLIEVLVAVLVLAIGLLGLSALQAAGVRLGHVARLNSVATLLTYDLADRIRSNPAGLAAGAYDLGDAVQHSACLGTAGCTPAAMADHDLYEWTAAAAPQSLASLLPSGQGLVCRDGTPQDGTPDNPACDGAGAARAIKVWWNDARDGTLRRVVTSVQP